MNLGRAARTGWQAPPQQKEPEAARYPVSRPDMPASMQAAWSAHPPLLFVQRRQDAVVPADLEVDLLFHPRVIPWGWWWCWHQSQWSQHPTIAVKHTTGSSHHCVTIFIFILLHGWGTEFRNSHWSTLLVTHRNSHGCVNQAYFSTSSRYFSK